MAVATVRFSRTEDLEGLRAWMLRAEITDATDLPVELFVFNRHVPSPSESLAPGIIPDDDIFDRVASIPDIHQYPVDSPDEESGGMFYRLSSVELVFTDLDSLQDATDVIEQALNQLVREANHLETVAEVRTVEITGT